METKDVKKIIICFSICILCCVMLFTGGYLFGRNRRISSISNSGAEAEYQLKELTRQLQELESKQAESVARCEELEQQLSNTGLSIDECIGTAGQLGNTVSELNSTSGNIGVIINLLKSRIGELQERTEQLTEQLQRAKNSTVIE